MKKDYIKSLLFIPGHKKLFFKDLIKLKADALAIDLEDSVPLKKWYDEHMDFLTKGNRISREEAFEKLITIEPFNLYLNELEVFRGSENNE